MNANFKSLSLVAVFAVASACAVAATLPHSKTIVVESPETLPVLARQNADAMYLHDTSDGRTMLYIEAQNGQALTTLDVTDPARIQHLAEVQLPAASAYDFVQEVNDSSVIIRYRNGSGNALISFRHANRPELVNAPAFAGVARTEALGTTGLLIRASDQAHGSEPVRYMAAAEDYKVVDTSNTLRPTLLSSIPQVRQSLSKSDTGTLFLLNSTGVIVIRQLPAEQEHQAELDSMRGN